MAKVTIAEIAEAAGVSSATVSMVLSNKGKISENVITKVKTVANNLGYTKIHRKTAGTYVTESKTIGMLIDIDPDWDFAWRFIRPVLSNIEAVLKENNYIFLLIPINLDLQSEEIVERVISSKGFNNVSLLLHSNCTFFYVSIGILSLSYLPDIFLINY